MAIGWSRLFGVLLVLLLTSCSFFERIPKMFTPAKLEKPTIELVNVRVGKLSLFSQKLVVRLKATNPNDLKIPIASLSCSLELEELIVANGLVSEPFVIPALGEYEFDVTVSTSILKMSRPLAKLLKAKKKTVDYRVSGMVKLDILFVDTFSFKKEGKIDIDH
jgi:LEA14-like dessication related protein